MPDVILVIIVSFIVSLVLTKFIITFSEKLNIGQNISEDVPESHLLKGGTASFGGISMFCSFLISVGIFARDAFLIHICLIIIFGYSLVGFLDDYLNFKKTTKALGLKARYKILLQLILAIISAVLLYKDTTLSIPVLNLKVDLQNFYIPFVVLVFVASTNAVNLTDGLDGLCAGVSIIGLCGFLYFSVISNNFESILLCASFIGALLGFLWFNTYPAKIFMGNTGSLMLGSVFATISILTKKELALILIGGIFVIEALSVIIQVVSFKLRKKRVFKMAPLHHHFELCGWDEAEIVIRFWILSALFVVAGVWLWR